jgi:hypothetical protein
VPPAYWKSLPVAFRIIWPNVSEPFGVVSALRRNPSQTEAATNMAAIHKQNQIFTPIVGATLGSREGTLVLPRRSSGLSGTPNSSQTLRQIAIKATLLDRRSHPLCHQPASAKGLGPHHEPCATARAPLACSARREQSPVGQPIRPGIPRGA